LVDRLFVESLSLTGYVAWSAFEGRTFLLPSLELRASFAAFWSVASWSVLCFRFLGSPERCFVSLLQFFFLSRSFWPFLPPGGRCSVRVNDRPCLDLPSSPALSSAFLFRIFSLTTVSFFIFLDLENLLGNYRPPVVFPCLCRYCGNRDWLCFPFFCRSIFFHFYCGALFGCSHFLCFLAPFLQVFGPLWDLPTGRPRPPFVKPIVPHPPGPQR